MYLAKYFRANKQFGSADRRFYKQACYAFWRFGSKQQKITIPTLLGCLLRTPACETEMRELAIQENYADALDQKTESVIHLFENYISPKINQSELVAWFENEAPVYLLPYPRREKETENALKKAEVDYSKDEAFFKTQKSPAIQALLDQGLCRVQDKASAASVQNLEIPVDASVWDCCCGAGGKSLTLKQWHPRIHQFCSDSRVSILSNLKTRFKQAGFPQPETAVINLNAGNPTQETLYDVVLADVPCSGSGTWRHNPEQPHFFETTKIDELALLQQKIISNALSRLKSGGMLIYLTCSVFTQENEANAAKIANTLHCELISEEYLGGLTADADYIYRAIFRYLPN